MQAAVRKKYSAQLSLATLICFLGTLQATVLSLAVVRDSSQWALGWDINLLAAVYSVSLPLFFIFFRLYNLLLSVITMNLYLFLEGVNLSGALALNGNG